MVTLLAITAAEQNLVENLVEALLAVPPMLKHSSHFQRLLMLLITKLTAKAHIDGCKSGFWDCASRTLIKLLVWLLVQSRGTSY